jgi:hypothetical protein
MRRIILLSVPCLAEPYVSTLSHYLQNINAINIRPARADRRTDEHEEANNRFSHFAKWSNKKQTPMPSALFFFTFINYSAKIQICLVTYISIEQTQLLYVHFPRHYLNHLCSHKRFAVQSNRHSIRHTLIDRCFYHNHSNPRSPQSSGLRPMS